jgi:alpha 1,6-mannosyltransferase
MLLPAPSSFSKFFNCHTLLAVLAILICYEVWSFRDTALAVVPQAFRPTHQHEHENTHETLPTPQDHAHEVLSTPQEHIHEIPAQIPPEPSKPPGIPKTLWYKLGPSGLSDDTRTWTSTCIDANPGYHAEFMTDESSDTWVRATFASRPDIVDIYTRLTVPIFKADILRYLLLYAHGGIWSDLDVSCEGVPIDEWVPSKYQDDANLVVGWEFDVGWEGQYVRQFTSWIIMARPHSPHMMQVVDDILATLREKTAANGFSVEEANRKNVGDVVDFSGPRRLTRSIYASLGKQMNKSVGANDFKEIYEPRLLGDVLVMPGRSFAASANRYEEGDEARLPPQLVEHHYAGTWKNEQGGE